VGIFCVQQFWGINAIIYYSTNIFKTTFEATKTVAFSLPNTLLLQPKN